LTPLCSPGRRLRRSYRCPDLGATPVNTRSLLGKARRVGAISTIFGFNSRFKPRFPAPASRAAMTSSGANAPWPSVWARSWSGPNRPLEQG